MRIFVTGASGWIGSGVVPELLEAGHEVVGLARSEASAQRLEAAGAIVLQGDLDDPDGLTKAAADSDGVIHLAFQHEVAFGGNFAAAGAADRRAVEAMGAALAGSDRPFVLASGILGLSSGGRVASEDDGLVPGDEIRANPAGARAATALLTLSLRGLGVRSSVLRFPPTVHGDGDKGFMATLVGIARARRRRIRGRRLQPVAGRPLFRRRPPGSAGRRGRSRRVSPARSGRRGRGLPQDRRGYGPPTGHPNGVSGSRRRARAFRLPGPLRLAGLSCNCREDAAVARLGADGTQPPRRPRRGSLHQLGLGRLEARPVAAAGERCRGGLRPRGWSRALRGSAPGRQPFGAPCPRRPGLLRESVETRPGTRRRQGHPR